MAQQKASDYFENVIYSAGEQYGAVMLTETMAEQLLPLMEWVPSRDPKAFVQQNILCFNEAILEQAVRRIRVSGTKSKVVLSPFTSNKWLCAQP